MLFDSSILGKGVRKGEELKAPYYTSAVLSYNDYITIYNIIPNKALSTAFLVSTAISINY